MFTGIVQSMGQIAAMEPTAAGIRLTLGRGDWAAAIAPGDSVCVSGVCLTAVTVTSEALAFDVIPETLDKSTLGQRCVGDRVNLEIAVAAGQPMGGHVVQGHVDGVGRVVGRTTDDGWRLTIEPPPELVAYLVPKGSVTLDGVSLTLAAVHDGGRFEVALIPETLARTTLGQADVGDVVNVEMDVMSKTIVHHLRHFLQQTPKVVEITMPMLRDAGFFNEPRP